MPQLSLGGAQKTRQGSVTVRSAGTGLCFWWAGGAMPHGAAWKALGLEEAGEQGSRWRPMTTTQVAPGPRRKDSSASSPPSPLPSGISLAPPGVESPGGTTLVSAAHLTDEKAEPGRDHEGGVDRGGNGPQAPASYPGPVPRPW